MGFWLVAFLWLGSFVLGELLRPKPRLENAQPSTLEVPTAEEGRPIPWAFGTVKVKAPNVIWWGDAEARPIKKKFKTGLFSSTTQVIGYQYFVGEQLGICLGPIDALVDILFDDKTVGGGGIVVESGRNQIVFGNTPPPWETATVPAGTYADPVALAIATEDAMDAEDPGTWKVPYGFHLIPGRSSELVYAVQGDFGAGFEALDITVDVGGVYLSGRDVAIAIAAIMNGSERRQTGGARVEWTCDYDDSSGHFFFGWTALRGTVDGIYIRGIVDYDLTCLVNIGFQPGVDHFGSGASGSIEGEFEVREDRYTFGFGGIAGKLDTAAPTFTALNVYGLAAIGVQNMPVLAAAARSVPSFISVTALSADLTRVVVNAPDLFGGAERGGGIVGTIDIYMGSTTQLPSDYLEAVLGTRLPAYRRLCYAVFRHLYVGTANRLALPAFVIRRTPNGLELADDHHNINGDANPLCALFELCTSTSALAAIPVSLIDVDAFVAAAETCFTEGLGVSMIIDQQAAAGDVATEILRHIDGVMYVDPFTGKITVGLARADYDVDDLPLVDEAVLQREGGEDGDGSTLEFSRPSWDETRNVVKARFVDRLSNFTERIAQEQDNANIQTRGGQRSVEQIDFRGFTNYEVAQRAASRALKALAYPLAALSFQANRKTWKLRPGAMFKFTSDRLLIEDLPCRVTRISTGDPRKGTIRIDAVEDVFGIDTPSYTPPVSGWTDPGATPRALVAERLEEAPYGLVGAEDRKVMTMGSAGSATGLNGYQVWSDPLGGVAYTETQTVPGFTPFGSLVGTVGPSETTIVVSGIDLATLTSVSAGPFALGLNVLLLDDEWIAWQTITDNGDGTWTLSGLARGCLDSTPVVHYAGADAWFSSARYGFTQDDPYADDGTIAAKLRPYRGAELTPLALCQRLPLVLASRAFRPAVPAKVRINGSSYPETIPSTGDVTITWAHRDRTDPDGLEAYDQQNATAAIEAGTHYRLRIYGGDGVLKRTVEPTTDLEYVYTNADEMADNSGDLNEQLRFVLDSVQDAGDELESRQAFDWIVDRGTVAPPVSLSAAGRIMVRPTDMTGDGATSTRGSGVNTIAVRNFPQVSDRLETSTFVVPDDFTALVKAELVYCNTGVTADPFVMRLGLQIQADTVDATSAPTFGTNETITPPATQDEIDIHELPLPAVTLAPGQEVRVVLQRKPGGAGADTNADDMAVLGLVLTYG